MNARRMKFSINGLPAFTDNFESYISGNTIVGQGNWISVRNGIETIVIDNSGNKGLYCGVGAPSANSISVPIFNANQYAQIKISKLNAPDVFSGLIVRSSGIDSSSNYYFAMASSTDYYIGYCLAGTETYVNGAGISLALNDVLKLTSIGNTISFYKNGGLIDSFTNNSISSGNPGVYLYGNSNQVVSDNFECSNL